MDKQEFLDLLDRYNKGEATEEECQKLVNYYNSFQVSGNWNAAELGESDPLEQKMLEKIEAVIQTEQRPLTISIGRRLWTRIAAACILLAATAGIVFMLNRTEKRPVLSDNINNGVNSAMATNNVRLTLANGRIIVLDNLTDGVVATDGNTILRKTGNVISCEYNRDAQTKYIETTGNNTITVPRGWQYSVVLLDGSKVWLNTSSSLSFPSSFANSSRDVELTGEAYFEIAKDVSKPFRVNALHDKLKREGTLVEVLGTHFNINAYDDEQVTKTTLLEGSVRISKGLAVKADQSRILEPGQEALVESSSTQMPITVVQADTDVATAWKSGLFNFKKADIQTIMREIARWYNVDVVYESAIPVRSFSGKFRRTLHLSNVLEILEQSNIRFRIQGNTVIVTA